MKACVIIRERVGRHSGTMDIIQLHFCGFQPFVDLFSNFVKVQLLIARVLSSWVFI